MSEQDNIDDNIHGTGFALDGVGILLRGPSGAGKSLLTLQLMDDRTRVGGRSVLVSDDRVVLKVIGDRLEMSAPPSIGGLIELRGRGIVSRPQQNDVRLNLVVDLVDEMHRMVEEDDLEIELRGIKVARCPIPHRGLIDPAHQLLLVREALRAL